jgi:hypothetical protein
MINLSNKICHTCGHPMGKRGVCHCNIYNITACLGPGRGVLCWNKYTCMVNPWEGDRRRYESGMNLIVYIFSPRIWGWWVVVYRPSETSTYQSDLIIRSDDRFLNLVVDSDSIVSKIYMLNFVLWFFFMFFFLSPCWQKYCSFIPAGLFCPHTDNHLAVLSKCTFDTQSIHIFELVYYLSTSRNSPFYIKCYTYGKRSFVLF